MNEFPGNCDDAVAADSQPPNANEAQCGGISRRTFTRAGISGLATSWMLASNTAAVARGMNLAPTKTPAAEAATSVLRPMRIYGDDAHPVWHRRAQPLNVPRGRYPGFRPGSELLRQGQIRRDGAMPLRCDIRFDRDVAVTLRDGTVIYADIFRPAKPGHYPAIVAWSPYGKEIGNQHLDDIPGRSNVPLSSLSELQKWEALDPAYWVDQGYVILNPDSRGSYMSQGDIPFWGRQLAEDGYDFIEWAARQEWSNGKIGMAGNSWLTISQWFIAAERPPHLAAIAPWEGFTDTMRDQAMRGGIPQVGFNDGFLSMLPGNQLIDDTVKMTLLVPDETLYWKDKSCRLENITVPAYVVASYENGLHTRGTFDGFRRISSKQKWLRVHNSHEWFDLYQKDSTRELQQFFDFFLKGEQNGWDQTPQIRISVLDPAPAREDVVNRVVDSWPPTGYAHNKLFLKADKSMSSTPTAHEQVLRYPAIGGSATFRMKLDADVELVGYMKLKLWVEADGSNDLDLVVSVEKLDSQGKALPRKLPQGGTGATRAYQYQRASRRKLDPTKSTEAEPFLLLQGEELLKAGEIVPLEIPFWPMALRLSAGEILQVTVTPYVNDSSLPPFGTARITIPAEAYTFDPGIEVPMQTIGDPSQAAPAWLAAQACNPDVRNAGTHILHCGGRYDSHLYVPLKAV